VWKKLLEEYMLNVTDEFYEQYIHGNDDASVYKLLFEGLSKGPTLDELRKKKNELFVELAGEAEVIGGAREFVGEAIRRGHEVAIVTNSNRVVAEEIVRRVGFPVKTIYIGSECKEPKPSPEPYLVAMRGAGERRTYIFEDSKSGLLSASHAHPVCIVGVASKNMDEVTLTKYGAQFVIDSYSSDLFVKLAGYVPAADSSAELTTTRLVANIRASLVKGHNDISAIDVDTACMKGGYINDVIRCTIRTPSGALRAVCKLENKRQTTLSEMATAVCLYDREYFFYESLYSYIPIRVPRYIGTIRDSATLNRLGIILEDVSQYKLSPDINTMRVDDVCSIIGQLVKMHSHFMGKGISAKFPGLYTAANAPYRSFMTKFMADNVGEFVRRWGFMMDEEVRQLVTNACAGYDELHEEMSRGDGMTLCHGDFKAPNMFWDESTSEIVMIDWQYIIEGKGTQDLVFFMIESLSMERFREIWQLLVVYYYEKLREAGCKYERAAFVKDVRNSVMYFPLFVAVWFGTTDAEHLLDKNFPFFFIKKFVNAVRTITKYGVWDEA
jgi:beta-phosphoglucomutase-like phosphatase (HAD superfamily)